MRSGQKSVLKRNLQVEVSLRTSNHDDKVDVVIIDGGALLWAVHWPSKGLVKDFVEAFLQTLVRYLQRQHVHLVFDRYHDFSVKSAIRATRTKFGSRKIGINMKTPLPSQQVTVC